MATSVVRSSSTRLCERALRAVRLAGGEGVRLWHDDPDLYGVEAVMRHDGSGRLLLLRRNLVVVDRPAQECPPILPMQRWEDPYPRIAACSASVWRATMTFCTSVAPS